MKKKFDNFPLSDEVNEPLDEIFKDIIDKKSAIQQTSVHNEVEDISLNESDNKIMPITWFLIFSLFVYIVYYFFTK